MQRNAPSKIDPEMLGELNYEQKFTQSISSNKRLVKMDKGKAWRIRYLPAKLGPKKTFFARIAKHWLATKPIICPRLTSPAFGGDPDAYCPVCDRSNELNDSTQQAEAQLGYEARSSPQWLAYCIVFEKDGLEQDQAELVIPYEHWMYKSTWEELKAFYMAGGQKSPLSILDYKLGNDFVLSRNSKGFKLDKQDSMAIFALDDPKYPEWIKKIEEHLKTPRVVLPTDEELQAFALKLEEQVNKLRGISTAGARRGRPATGLEENDDTGQEDRVDDPEPPSRSAPARSVPARRQPEPEPSSEGNAAGDDDQVPGAEVPAKPVAAKPAAVPARPAAPAPRPAAPAAAVRRSAPQPEPEPEPAPAEAEADQPEPEPEPEPAPAPRVQAGRAMARPAAPAPRRAPPQPDPDADDDNLPPDETADQAPPAPMEGEENAEPASAPPPVSRRGAALGSAIKDKINAVKNRGL